MVASVRAAMVRGWMGCHLGDEAVSSVSICPSEMGTETGLVSKLLDASVGYRGGGLLGVLGLRGWVLCRCRTFESLVDLTNRPLHVQR